MLIQVRKSELWLIAQHDHGLISGYLAHLWRGKHGDERLSHQLCLATSLHDQSWHTSDATPQLDTATGRPHDFLSAPLEWRLRLYADGLDALESVSPDATYRVSMHYTNFAGLRRVEQFQVDERRRRARLQREHGWRGDFLNEAEQRATRDLRWLQFFDLLSLHLCLVQPSALAIARPSWLIPVEWKSPTGATYRLNWHSDSRLSVDPFPFRQSVEVHLPVRRLAQTSYDNQAALESGFKAAKRWSEVLTISPV